MPWIPFVKTGYLGTNEWVPLVNGNGLTAGGGEPEPPAPVPTYATVTGIAPLALIGAIQHDIRLLKQFGKCTQASTPTPSDPVDIVCNNGALRMVDDELPSGYKRVLGFQCNDNAMWQITGFKLRGSDTVRISFSVTAACNVFGCYQGTSATDNYDLYASITAGSKYFRYGSGTYLSYFSNDNLNQRFDVTYTPTGSSGMPQDSTWSALTFESANDLLLGSTTTTGTSAKLKGNLYGNFIVENGGVERLHLVPCERVSDNALGYYDLIGETFYEQDETYNGAVSLGYDGSHYSLQTVGTPEVLTISGKNLNAGTLAGVGYTSTGAESTSSTFVGTLCKIPCEDGEKYTVSFGGFTTTGISGVFINTWKTDGTFNSRQAIASSGVTTYTIPSGVRQVNFTLYKTGGATIDDGAWMQVERGDTATTYEPYVTPQTVNDVPMLLSVGAYADEAEIISGLLTHKVGIYVFTGEEAFTKGTAFYTTNVKFLPSALENIAPFCTHFRGIKPLETRVADSLTVTVNGVQSGALNPSWQGCVYFYADHSLYETANDFKAWLASEYANGTPVIVLYPLADETTEQTTAHNLHTTAGDNVVSVVSNVDPVTLEAEYANGYE